MNVRDESDSVRRQIIVRTTLLFGEERTITNRDEIEAATVAIHRLKRMPLKEFTVLDPESRS